MAGLFSVRNLTIERPSVHVSGDSGWSEFYWTFNATLRENGSPVGGGQSIRRSHAFVHEKDYAGF
jgi:hypothetical protein